MNTLAEVLVKEILVADRQSSNNRRISLKLVGSLALALGLVGFLSAAKPGQQVTKDAETCGACHEDTAKGLSKSPHGTMGDKSCTACHAGSEKHLQDGGGTGNIFAFKATAFPGEKIKPCLTCHAAHESQFLAGPHGKASLDCTTCHSVHASKTSPSLLKATETQTCRTCHEDIFAKFQLNERHRLKEGLLTCSTCHDPHAPAERERLGGFKQETCLKCHADKGGPFLYEHGPNRVESCTICHESHGSTNRHLLTTPSVPDLCFGCHTFTPSWHAKFSPKDTNCAVCHSSIHGSNLSRIFIK